MKKLVLFSLSLLTIFSIVQAQDKPDTSKVEGDYWYHVGYPRGLAISEKIPAVKVWFFKDRGDYTTMMDKITFAKDFKKGFGTGYGKVNEYTVAYLPKAGALLEAASGELLPGIGTASQIAADVHTLLGTAFKPGLKFAVKELKKKYKKVRIGYASRLEPGEYYRRKDPYPRKVLYMVVTLGDDVRKDLEGPANKIDMYPLWQGYVYMPEGKDKLFMNVIPVQAGTAARQVTEEVEDEEGEKVKQTVTKIEPVYSANVVQLDETAFNAQDFKWIKD